MCLICEVETVRRGEEILSPLDNRGSDINDSPVISRNLLIQSDYYVLRAALTPAHNVIDRINR